jgi:hypothetical protein
MIHRKLLMATAIVAAVVTTACSDTTAPKKDPGVFPVATKAATVVATVNGGGTAVMQPGGFAQGRSAFGMGVKLLSDGSATGHFDCVDQHGGTVPGNIFGEVISWRMEGPVVVLNVTGKLVSFPGGHPQDISFTVKIQRFGGAEEGREGRWTLEVGEFVFCDEVLTSGQIVYRPA